MSDKKKYSMFIRIVCGLIGALGIAAAIYNAIKAESFSFEFKLIAMAFAFFIFIYVAITGTSPLEKAKKTDESN